MLRTAVFVDAAFLFQQAGLSLAGARQERSDLVLDVAGVLAELRFVAGARAPETSFLRVYWYDLIQPGARLTSDQALLSNSDGVKVRLCSTPSLGSCRSLAAPMAADLIELARNGVLSDALLVAGDEDLRISVQLAQSHGVRVHLINVATGRPALATPLTQEVDTNMEWARETLQRFVGVRRNGLQDGPQPASSFLPPSSSEPQVWEPRLEAAARDFADALEDSDLDALEAYWATSRGVPSELDRRLLPYARGALGRDLDQAEKRFVRTCFQKQVMERFDAEEVE